MAGRDDQGRTDLTPDELCDLPLEAVAGTAEVGIAPLALRTAPAPEPGAAARPLRPART